jgi:hypothetical protein
MLEHLFLNLSAQVPRVPPHKINHGTFQTTLPLDVPPVPLVPSDKTSIKPKVELSASDHQKLLDYLAVIGENDPCMIDELLGECSRDAKILAAALSHAEEVLNLKHDDTTGLVQCANCGQLAGDMCQFNHWRVVAEKWRRCADYQTIQKTKNTESAELFT